VLGGDHEVPVRVRAQVDLTAEDGVRADDAFLGELLR
jgi:hypothetical protein